MNNRIDVMTDDDCRGVRKIVLTVGAIELVMGLAAEIYHMISVMKGTVRSDLLYMPYEPLDSNLLTYLGPLVIWAIPLIMGASHILLYFRMAPGQERASRFIGKYIGVKRGRSIWLVFETLNGHKKKFRATVEFTEDEVDEELSEIGSNLEVVIEYFKTSFGNYIKSIAIINGDLNPVLEANEDGE